MFIIKTSDSRDSYDDSKIKKFLFCRTVLSRTGLGEWFETPRVSKLLPRKSKTGEFRTLWRTRYGSVFINTHRGFGTWLKDVGLIVLNRSLFTGSGTPSDRLVCHFLGLPGTLQSLKYGVKYRVLLTSGTSNSLNRLHCRTTYSEFVTDHLFMTKM